MKINKKNILASFVDYDQRTQDNLEIILKEVSKQGKELSEYSLVMFQLLAVQFEIFYKAYDAISEGIVNTTQVGERTVHAPKPQLEALQKANVQINNMLKSLGLSPLEQAKIKKLNENPASREESATELFSELIS